MRKIKLSAYAKEMGISYLTASRWFHTNKIPYKCEQMPSGAIFVYMDDLEIPVITPLKELVIYARVSSHDQKDDLDRQVARLTDFAMANGFVIKDVVKEIASGMNQHRAGLLRILNNPTYTTILVEHRDRLARFGFDLVNTCLKSSGRQIIVVNETEQDMDLVQDFIDVITSMCSRIYGKRGAQHRIDHMKKALD